jgi:hypothetical protein
MQVEALLQHFLMYLVVPVWLLAGLGNWFCHRVARIEATSGVRESMMHLVQFAPVGLPLLVAVLHWPQFRGLLSGASAASYGDLAGIVSFSNTRDISMRSRLISRSSASFAR